MSADAAKPETTALVQRSAFNFVGLAAANALQFALVLMIMVSVVLYAVFKRRDWI